MEDSPQENLTTRSLLKGILATEIVRPAVKHQPKQSIRHASVSRIQEKIPASPTMSLRSQMKARVRQSFGKLALGNSSVKRNANAKNKKKTVKKGFQNIVEELNNITPQSLLKKIIQNEDEVSILVSQRSKAAAVDHPEQEGTSKQSSLSIVDLSLPDLQDTGHVDVFRISRKKKRMNSSQFEREVDKKLPKNGDNSSKLKENVEELTSFVNPNVTTRSFEDHLDVSIDPQSTYKRALLRKPNKAFLVSLGDFEQGVEDKYHLIKGSQECFVESIMEDKSSVSTRGVAELNTELYVPPVLSEINTLYSENRLSMSSSLVSSDKKKYSTGNMSNSANIVINVPPKAVFSDIQTTEMMEENTKYSATTSNKWKSVLMVKDVEHLDTNQSMQKSLPVLEDEIKFELDKNIHKSVSAAKKISHFGTKKERGTEKSVLMVEDVKLTEEARSTENSVLTVENTRSFQLRQSLSKSLLQDKDGRPIIPYWKMQKSELVEAKEGDSFDSNVNKEVEMMETADNAEYETLHAVLAETKGTQELDRLSCKIQNSKFNKEDSNQYTKSLNVSSRQEDNAESSQCHNSENLLQAESTMEGDVVSPEAKVTKPMISALIETPAYIRKARLTIPPNKLVAGKKIHRKTALKIKKDGSAFKSSLVKKILSLHAKMQLSKNASTDAEKFLEMFLDQMTNDLAAYTAHANRKTITLADLELLMKRQRLVIDTTSFNVLIERHLPLECRKLLISCAMSGNKVFPKM